MKLILIFGVWLNLSSITGLREYKGYENTCHINTNRSSFVILNHSCNEVAAEINKNIELNHDK